MPEFLELEAEPELRPVPGRAVQVSFRHGGKAYLLRRLPGGAREAGNLCLAAGAGLAPRRIGGAEDWVVTEFLEGATAADPESVARCLRRLHDSGLPFEGEVDPFAAAGLGPDPAPPAERVPLHGDAHRANALLHGGRCWLVDWEYAALGDRHWDLAYYAAQARLEGEGERRFLSAYGSCDGERYRSLLPVARLLWDKWNCR